ncbi:Bone morphogenetic protein 15 [Frankliniella fusca]|uniref:Bone morphogenetic protein 15 n=1 Tax=Frankliniella fusca TaxID=407009 RepID=A0AAE1LRA1_9NEOP|nr:Bone morphogenetic protein 15 [Frankliniella fusca]
MTTSSASSSSLSRPPRRPHLLDLLERAPMALLLLLPVLLFSPGGSGFAVHHRHPHHHARHHGHHHPLSPESTVSPEPDAPAAAALLDAVRAADLADAAWGRGSGDPEDGAGVPLFMKVLLRDTELGTIFNEFSQPVAAPAAAALNNKTLASCVQPSRVSVGRSGAMVVEFPGDSDSAGAGGWWLVLSTQPGAAALAGAVLSVFVGASEDLRLVAEHPLPNATFLAVDVTEAMEGAEGSWRRFVVDVSSAGPGPAPLGAAGALEVAGWERGPLLVRALDWGDDQGAAGAAATSRGNSGLRIWSDVPEDLVHPPRVRSRRRSHRRSSSSSSTTTEGPANTSGENPLQNAARTELKPDSGEQVVPDAADEADDAFCHLEAWTVSVADLKWDFIVAPRTLDINFCVGRCPPVLYEKRFNASTNAIARNLIKQERGERAGVNIPDPQCVPIRFKPIALLMKKSSGNVDLFTSYDLSADRCGCR